MNKRTTQKTFKVFCEGDSEYFYFDGFKKTKRLSLKLRPVNMDGGGYSSFLKEIRKDSSTNCIAKFIVIDADKAITDYNELDKLKQLVQYCKIQNDTKRVPHILIIDSPSFEYVACLHSASYKGADIKKFITSQYHYRSISEYKADEKIYDVLNSSGCSYAIYLKNCKRINTVIQNTFSIKPSKYHISVGMSYDYSLLGAKSSNFFDFFEVLRQFEKSV